jgi:putative spermidine/putrescine transport system substrate-binding protein
MSSKQNSGALASAMVSGIEVGSVHLTSAVNDLVGEDTKNFNGNSYSDARDQRRLVSAVDEDDSSVTGKKNHPSVSTIAQIVTICLVALIISMLFALIGVSSATYDEVKDYSPVATVTTAYPSLGLPGYEGYSWVDVVGAASGGTVNWYTYNDNNGTELGPYNKWIDTWLTPNLAENFDITLIRHPISNTGDAVDKVISEINAGYGMNNGTIDMIWINGENFSKMKTGGYAYGPWASKVPNAANYDFQSDAIKYDFGLTTNGYEMPYNEAQVVFIYDSAKVNASSISDMDALLAWVKTNPKKFVYPSPYFLDDSGTDFDSDYTGSVFIRQVFYNVVPDYTKFMGAFNEPLYEQYAPAFYKTLRDLQPYLYNASASKLDRKGYPTSQEQVDQLFASGDISVTLSYDIGHAAYMVESANWPSTTRSLVLTSGTIANTNFVLIPANAKNKLAAVVAGNYIASAQAMFSRAQPEVIGALQAYDPTCDNFVAGGWNDAFAYIDRPTATPSNNDLARYRLSELSSTYINRIQEDWYACVLTYSSASPSYCG